MKNFFLKFNNKKVFLIIALVLILAGSLIGGTYEYSVYKSETDTYIEAYNFYFDSDYLTEDGEVYMLSVDTKSVTFELRNFADSLRWSENDIEYTVSSTGGSLNITSGTLDKGEKSVVKITLEGLVNGGEYTITAKGSAGFEKTLSATFKVRNLEDGFYKYINEVDPYVILTVWTENISGEVTILFPSGLIPDNTCEGMENVKTNEGSFTVSLGVYSSFEFRFFKTSNYDDTNDFTVTMVLDDKTITAILNNNLN